MWIAVLISLTFLMLSTWWGAATNELLSQGTSHRRGNGPRVEAIRPTSAKPILR